MNEEETPYKAAWEIGRSMSAARIRNKRPLDHLEDFVRLFPDILKSCNGDQIQEAILFTCMETYWWGYYRPGFGFPFADRAANKALTSEPGSPKRKFFIYSNSNECDLQVFKKPSRNPL